MNIILLLTLVIRGLEAYNVLIVYAFPVKSLSILGHGLTKHLLNAGHKVTFITAYPSRKNLPNYREIDVSSNIDYFISNRNRSSKISFALENKAIIFDIEQNQKAAVHLATLTFQNEWVQNLLRNREEKFDVVISDYIETEVYASLAALYQCPMIWSYSLGPNWISMRLLGEVANPAYTADYLSYNIHPFTFYQRVQELWAQIKWRSIKWFKVMPLENQVYNDIFEPIARTRNMTLPSYDQIVFNASLILSNYNPAFGGIMSLPQNFKMVGGYHIENPVKALPANLQATMDNATDGVVYFSMGSMWKSKDFPVHVRNELLHMFSKLNKTVIWKYEETISGLPDNVNVVNWAPQQSILSHPKLSVFITHGGLLSTIEAVHFGVPIIGIPVHYDQFININKAVTDGYALKVDLCYNLANALDVALKEMLRSPRYKEKAKELSIKFNHRTITPGAEAVFWIEHVIETDGASHLRSPSVELSLYQQMYLDLFVLVLILITVVYYIAKHCDYVVRKHKIKVN